MTLTIRTPNNAKGDSNRYCGPAALSAVTGMTTGEAARLIRSVSGQTAVRGTHTVHLLRALTQCGVGHKSLLIENPKHAPTFAHWLRDTHGQRGGRVFLIVYGHHFGVVSGNRYVCSLTRGVVPLDDKRIKRRARVTRVFELYAPGPVTIPAAARKVTAAADPEKKAQAASRAAAHRLAREIGVVFDWEFGKRFPVYVHHPDLSDDEDPCQGDHYAYDWTDVLLRVRDYERHLRQQAA